MNVFPLFQTLNEIMKVELIKDKTAEEIKQVGKFGVQDISISGQGNHSLQNKYENHIKNTSELKLKT